MKYGQYFNQQREQFPAAWQTRFIDYDALKAFLKSRMVDSSVRLAAAYPRTHIFPWMPASTDEPAFDAILEQRLAVVGKLTPEFVRSLDAEVEKFNNFFVTIKEETKARIAHALNSERCPEIAECEAALRDLLFLERFVFLNFTAITKALKKHDKWSGLQIREPYLMRTSHLSFVVSTSLLRLKPELMARLTGLLAENNASIESLSLPANPHDTISATAMLKSLAVGTESTPSTRVTTPSSEDLKSIMLSAQNGVSELGPLVELLHEKQTAMITLRGPHGTDIIGGVLSCLAKHHCQIVDFSLSRLHHDVTFGIIVSLHDRDVDLFSDLATTAQKWDGTLSFDIQDAKLKASKLVNSEQYSLSEAPYARRVKYMATVLNERGLTPEFLSEWLNWLLVKKISVEQMRRLDSHTSLMCVEFRLSVPDSLSPEEMKSELIAISTGHQTDVALQLDNVFRRQKRLVVFDMDSTLIQQEVIDEIARATGIEEQVAAITESAMQGEIDFKESLARRVALLKGTPIDALEVVKRSLLFTEGAHYLCRALKNAGFKLAVISGGFLPLAKYVKSELGLDYAFANQLKVTADGKNLTGETFGPVVDAVRKAELLEVIAQAEGIAIDQVVAVGDGANDLLMLGKASLGIAFNAKPRVQQQARARINQKSLANILYLMGYSESEAAELQI
ncbi:Phosphoserine phosphatase [Coemansia spiralis]|uniref:phosphoserine phosphatase n=2 Tax=Coemansia TaxID=4863 RepID=A0A9W8G9N7_9FUNG|nr:Phosphoserine phosphatase [Coemansia umbellata]KAJ2623501.1 Phosphoserine phosphatase [Coemansia sp. RSA 1358]KAJ2678928.1 Phosphoserine phosphatase [Coemansia spiralis]